MENRRAIIISSICVAVSLVLISFYLRVRQSELTKEFGPPVTVVVASQDIPEYGIIQANMLGTIQVFKNFRQPQSVEDTELLVGKASFVPIYAGEQIPLTKIIQKDGRPVLDRQVEKNMRAITLPISPVTGVGRLIRPGNRIDILASPNYDNNGTTIFEVKTMVQNVLVLATGKNLNNAVPTQVDKDVLGAIEGSLANRRRKDLASTGMDALPTGRPDDNYTSITLQLTPEDAEKVLFLSHTFGDNRLFFTLRNNADQQMPQLATVMLDQVLGPRSDYGRAVAKPPPSPPPRPPRFYDLQGSKQVPIR